MAADRTIDVTFWGKIPQNPWHGDRQDGHMYMQMQGQAGTGGWHLEARSEAHSTGAEPHQCAAVVADSDGMLLWVLKI